MIIRPTTKKAHMELSQEARLMKKYSSIISDSASQDQGSTYYITITTYNNIKSYNWMQTV